MRRQDILIDKFWSCVVLFEPLGIVYGFSEGIDIAITKIKYYERFYRLSISVS